MESYILVIGALIVFLLVPLAVIIVGVSIYNGLVTRRVETENAWAQIDVQLRRRFDLIPNLMETVKGYASHEKETLEKVIQARNIGLSANGRAEMGQADNMLTGALKTLFSVAEAYPDLKANQNFRDMQEELRGTENRIGFARQFYNDVVAQYNGGLQRFPANLIANSFGFRPVEFFQLGAQAAEIREAPKVKF